MDTNKKYDKRLDNLKPAKPGEVRNPKGRGKGRRDVKTVIWDAMQKIADSQNMTAEEIETLLQQTGIKHALKGNHSFYATINDRLYGKQKEKDVTVTVVTETNPEIAELTKKLNELHKQKPN
jgi:hypothetical protein